MITETMEGKLIEEEKISRQQKYLMLLNKIRSYKEKDEYETIVRPIIEKYTKKPLSLGDMSESELFFLAYTVRGEKLKKILVELSEKSQKMPNYFIPHLFKSLAKVQKAARVTTKDHVGEPTDHRLYYGKEMYVYMPRSKEMVANRNDYELKIEFRYINYATIGDIDTNIHYVYDDDSKEHFRDANVTRYLPIRPGLMEEECIKKVFERKNFVLHEDLDVQRNLEMWTSFQEDLRLKVKITNLERACWEVEEKLMELEIQKMEV